MICGHWRSAEMQTLIFLISQINERLSRRCLCSVIFLRSAKESAPLMDSNTKLMKRHLLAYRDKSHFFLFFLEQALRIRPPACNGINKMASSQTGECVNPPLPIENIYSRRDTETRLAAARGFVKIWLKWLRPVPAGELSPSLEVNPLLSYTKQIKTELSAKCNTIFGKMKNGSLDL